MIQKNILLLILFILLSALNAVAQTPQITQETKPQNDVLRIGSIYLPPYGQIDENGVKSGPHYELHVELGKATGLDFEVEIMPFGRMLQYLSDDKLDMIVAAHGWRAREVGEPLTSLYSTTNLLVSRKSSNIKTIADIRGKNIVYIRIASYPEFEEIPHNIIRVNEYRQSLQMLHSRSDIDAIIITELSYFYWLRQLGFNHDEFGPVIPMNTYEQWIYVNKKMPSETRELLAQAAQKMKQENTFDKLLEKHGIQ